MEIHKAITYIQRKVHHDIWPFWCIIITVIIYLSILFSNIFGNSIPFCRLTFISVPVLSKDLFERYIINQSVSVQFYTSKVRNLTIKIRLGRWVLHFPNLTLFQKGVVLFLRMCHDAAEK